MTDPRSGPDPAAPAAGFDLVTMLSPEDIAAILAWHYPAPYDLYDPAHDGADAYTDPAYRAIRTEPDGLIGFFCVGDDGQVPGGAYDDDALDLGLGLRPDWTGRGRGPEILRAVMAHVAAEHGARRLRATVAAFNVRALRACEQIGFRVVDRFRAARDGREFVIITLESPPRGDHAVTASRKATDLTRRSDRR